MEKDDARAGAGLKRVVLTGAESTGKTTLARRLAGHYGTVWVPEYLRRFVDEKGALPEAHDVDAIARGHLASVAALRPRARRVLFLDTDLISTVLYQTHFFGTCPAWVRAASYEHQGDLYLLLADDIPWVPDPGQRDGPEARVFFQRQFEAELLRRGVPFVRVAGPPEVRFRTAVAAVDRLLGPAVVSAASGTRSTLPPGSL
ncbi:ATP-binding protein [Rhodocaloribacter litoris]|uniref:AAA family ATPase n=1 Tax=Rhodocaloribacter litoris TaxID=2558931 RepID=UPI00142136D5|nr:ATP-binding protein [Rhodocaloribacter litoris]QXD16972.1 ATP-binding protein [Rhodocaloribacter litoris]